MLEKEKTLTNLWVGAGFLMQVFGLLIQDDIGIGWVLKLGGGALVLIGCCHYAIGKGYGWQQGFIGVIPIVGLLILILLPDGCKDGEPDGSGDSAHPPGTPMRESQLPTADQALFSRLRMHGLMLSETATRVLVVDGPAGFWLLPLKPPGPAARLSAQEEETFRKRGRLNGVVLSACVQHNDEHFSRVQVRRLLGDSTQLSEAVTMYADGRAELETAEPALKAFPAG